MSGPKRVRPQMLYHCDASLSAKEKRAGFKRDSSWKHFWRRLKGLTGRSAGPRGARAFTGDYERMGQKTFHASRQTGGWMKAAGVVAAGGAQAQSVTSKRCMSSCDALLCILSVRAVSIKLARSGANCRVNSCVALLSPKNFADGRSVSRRVRRRYGLATVVVLSDRIRLLRCRDGPLSPWSCGDGYSLYGGPGSCKGEGAGWALNCAFRIAQGQARRPRFSCCIGRQRPGCKRD